MGDWAKLGKELRDQFRLKTYPIGYKWFKNENDIDQIPNLRRMEHRFTFCQMIAQARRWGQTLGSKKSDRKMVTYCAMITGLMNVRPEMINVPTPGTPMSPDVERFVAGWEDGVRRNKSIPRIPVGGAVALAPLQNIAFDPDVILVYGDPSQIIVMIQSMQKIEFERLQFGCVGESSCSDSLAECYLTGKPKVSLPGYGERALGHVADEELVLALPPAYLGRVLDGFAALRKFNVTYPVTLAGIDVDIETMPSIYDRPVRMPE